jgi:hypothetical protein
LKTDIFAEFPLDVTTVERTSREVYVPGNKTKALSLMTSGEEVIVRCQRSTREEAKKVIPYCRKHKVAVTKSYFGPGENEITYYLTF